MQAKLSPDSCRGLFLIVGQLLEYIVFFGKIIDMQNEKC